jgi:hypothetical protein
MVNALKTMVFEAAQIIEKYKLIATTEYFTRVFVVFAMVFDVDKTFFNVETVFSKAQTAVRIPDAGFSIIEMIVGEMPSAFVQPPNKLAEMREAISAETSEPTNVVLDSRDNDTIDSLLPFNS